MLLRMAVQAGVRAAVLSTLIASSSAAAGLIPHILYGKRIAGEVVDVETGKPIAGAHVAFLWRSGITPSGFTGHNSRDICYHAAAATTDAQGRFAVAAWKEWSTYDVRPVSPTVLVYASGYRPFQRFTLRDSERSPVEHLDERYVLPRFKGSVAERLDSLFYGLANQGCDYGGESQKSLYPMLKAIYAEARAISSPAMRPTIHSFGVFAANAALAADPSGPSNDRDVESFIREHLE